jgi:maltokinase
MHLALAEAFGTTPADPAAWAEALAAGLDDLDDRDRVREARARYQRLAEIDDAGVAERIHGDLHLGQLLRNEEGWFVLDFEGEPVRPVAERQAAASPLRDVAGMVRSFHYAARTGLAERGRDVDDELVDLADAWEVRAVEAYLAGYHHVEGVDELLPANDADRDKVLRAFELDKAIYEVIYELAHRPDWVDIPASAVRRTLALAAG